jgi:hypothetical protein
MKSIFRTLVIAPVALAAVAFTAQSAMAAATVKVPFNFTVNGKECPAGLYAINRDSAKHIVNVRSVDGKETFNWVLNPVDKSLDITDENRVTLRFDEASAGHALKNVQFGSESTAQLDKQDKHSHINASPSGQGK